MIKVLVADDHTLFREGLRQILETEKDIKVVGEARTGEETVKKAKKLFPDIVLMDINMPQLNGIEATRRIKKDNPQINIIILTVSADQAHIFEALKMGARGYVVKDAASGELIKIIRSVYNGEAMLQPHITTQLLDEFGNTFEKSIIGGPESSLYTRLSNREIQVLKLVALGKTNKEIASALSLREKTVKNHIYNIFQKLHMNTRTQLALYAFRKRLVE